MLVTSCRVVGLGFPRHSGVSDAAVSRTFLLHFWLFVIDAEESCTFYDLLYSAVILNLH